MTEQEILERLALYLAAEKKILEGNQKWTSPDGITYERATLGSVRAEIAAIRQELYMVQNGGSYGFQSIVFGGRQ